MNIDELYEMIIHTLVFQAMTIQHTVWLTSICCGVPTEDLVLNIQKCNLDFTTIYRTYGSTINIKRLI